MPATNTDTERQLAFERWRVQQLLESYRANARYYRNVAGARQTCSYMLIANSLAASADYFDNLTADSSDYLQGDDDE